MKAVFQTPRLRPALAALFGSGYMEKLTVRLASGLARLPDEQVGPAREFLATTQRPDGGWAGREGESDLYYTSFAARGLALVNGLAEKTRDRLAQFLRGRLGRQGNIIDLVSLLYAGRVVHALGGPDVLPQDSGQCVVTLLESHRSADGGYAKTAGAAMGSTYHTFLAALACEMIRRPLPEPARIVEFLKTRRRDDGGFVELPVMKRSGTNPTAAAVALTRILRAPGDLTRGAADCLLSLQSSAEGGFCANRSMPVSDLLSTFTALLTLADLGALDRADRKAALAFVRSLAQPAGGFRGGAWDDQADVEYTFYGLGSLALLEGAR